MLGHSGVNHILEQLPLDHLSVELRRDLLDARAGSDPAALGMVVSRAVAELLQNGDLVRVAVAGATRTGHDLLLVHGTSRLIDCTGLPRPRPVAAPPAPEATATDEGASPAASHEASRISNMLDAMERAQDLAVGDPRADDPWIMIDRILDLLQLYLPDVRLHAQLSLVVAESEAVGKLLPQPDLAGMPFWLRHRRLGQSVWIPDVQELPRELQHRLDLEPSDHLATAVVPIVSPSADEGEVGLLYVTGQGTRSADDLLGLAQRLSAFVSRRWRCQRDVNRRVLNDSLTGIPNRAFFDTQFPLELERVRRSDQPLTLVIADLDHFKEINDTYGHHCGDLVLRSVARQLLSALRRIDVVCRIGGEEFALILPSTSDVEAREVLGRIVGRPFRVALPPELGVGQVPVTVSYGAVTFPEAGLSTGELHRKADGLLYEAKERGRNRCCLWTSRGTVELRRNDSVS